MDDEVGSIQLVALMDEEMGSIQLIALMDDEVGYLASQVRLYAVWAHVKCSQSVQFRAQQVLPIALMDDEVRSILEVVLQAPVGCFPAVDRSMGEEGSPIVEIDEPTCQDGKISRLSDEMRLRCLVLAHRVISLGLG